MTDVNVKDQKVPAIPPPAAILVNSGTDATGNTGWVFVTQCTSGTYTWIGGTTGAATDWQVPTNWNPTRATPAATDNLIFDGNSAPAPTVTNVPTETEATLRLKNGVNGVSLNASGTNILTLNGATGTDLDIPSGTLLTLAGGNALTISLTGAGHECTVAGQLIFQQAGHQLLGTNAGEITMTGFNAFTPAGTYPSSTHPFGIGTDGAVVFQSGARGAFNGGLDPFGGSGHSVVTFNLGSIAAFYTPSAFSFSGRTYGYLTLDGTQAYSGGSGSSQLTVFNTFELETGSTFTLSSTAGGDLNLLGAMLNVGGTGVLGTLNFVSGARTLSSMTMNRTSSGSATLGTDLAIGTSQTLTNGIVDVGSNMLSLNSAATASRTNGYVIGNVQKTFGATGSFTFPVGTANAYSPMDANVTAGTGNSLTIKATQGKQPNISGANALQRYWTISNAGSVTAN